MTTIREGLPPLPVRMSHLKIEDRGYPVPWFVAWFDGKPDFRVMDGDKLVQAVKYKKCWVCGEPLGRKFTFCIGPMCAINRTIAEPPSHHECVDFSARACPFLTLPKAHRREANLPDGKWSPTGLKRNPGVVLLWTTDSYRTFRGEGKEILFRIGDPLALHWISEGRTATREEILESINSGLPLLREMADAQGPDAIAAFDHAVNRGMQLVPAA
jgi:hypothetical protein